MLLYYGASNDGYFDYTVSLITESVWECPHWSFFSVHYVNVRACITFQDSLITRYIDFFADMTL